MQKNAKDKFIIAPETLIVEIAERFPHLAEILTGEYGFHCVGCPLMYAESIGEGAMVHGLNEKETEELIKKLNKLAYKDKDVKSSTK